MITDQAPERRIRVSKLPGDRARLNVYLSSALWRKVRAVAELEGWPSDSAAARELIERGLKTKTATNGREPESVAV